MKLNRILALFFCAALLTGVISSCQDDDEVSVTPPRDVTEVMLEDEEALQEYLNTHFYNYEEFQNPAEGFDYQIQFDTIEGENADKTPLMEQVQSKTIHVRDANDEKVEHTLYYLVAREGVGENPHNCDSVFVRYKGMLLTGDQFDNSTVPLWFNLIDNIRGFSELIPELKTGTYVGLDGGLPTYEDYGIGAVFFPSGLGYFNSAQSGIPAYSPLIFNVDLLSYEEADQDGDYIPNYLEYRDENGDLMDTDEDGVVDLADSDDDGDGALTKDEIEYEDYNEDGEITFDEVTLTDTDNDGTPDYLDPNIFPEDEE